MGRGKNSNLAAKKFGGQYCNQVIGSDESHNTIRTLHLCHPSISQENIRQTQIERHFIKSMTPQNFQGHEEQGKPKKLLQIRGDQGDMVSKGKVGLDPRTEKKALVEKVVNSEKVCNLVTVCVNLLALTNVHGHGKMLTLGESE